MQIRSLPPLVAFLSWFAFLTTAVHGQWAEPQLIADLNPENLVDETWQQGSSPSNFTECFDVESGQNQLYFTALHVVPGRDVVQYDFDNDASTPQTEKEWNPDWTNLGYELFKTDGTSAGTKLVGELNTTLGAHLNAGPVRTRSSFWVGGNSDLTPSSGILRCLNGELIFSATDSVPENEIVGVANMQLWKSDGVTLTKIMRASDPLDSIVPYPHVFETTMFEFQGQLFVVDVNSKLWRTDGTSVYPVHYDPSWESGRQATVTFHGTQQDQLFAVLDDKLYFQDNLGRWLVRLDSATSEAQVLRTDLLQFSSDIHATSTHLFWRQWQEGVYYWDPALPTYGHIDLFSGLESPSLLYRVNDRIVFNAIKDASLTRAIFSADGTSVVEIAPNMGGFTPIKHTQPSTGSERLYLGLCDRHKALYYGRNGGRNRTCPRLWQPSLGRTVASQWFRVLSIPSGSRVPV